MGAAASMHRPVALALLGLMAVAATETSMSTMPLFTWSGHSDTLASSQSAAGALKTALESGKPEVVLVYMLNEASTHDMQSQQAAYTHLQDALDNARSSAFAALPVAKVDINSMLAVAESNQAVGRSVESSGVEALLAAHPEMLSDSKPDVLVVRFPEEADAATADALIGATEKAVSAATAGKYDSILSTTSSMEAGSATNLAFRFSQAANTRGYPEYTGPSMNYRNTIMYGSSRFLTPSLLVAIMITIYMGFLALAAYCCILSLQTPEKFEGDQEKDMQHALNPDGK